jgi:hypothetical protein
VKIAKVMAILVPRWLDSMAGPAADVSKILYAHRFYRVPLLKVSRLGKCTQNRKMVWHFYGKTKTAIISSKNQFRPQF